jgi:hypothetical protein
MAPVPVITRMWRAMGPVTKRGGGGGATIGAGGNAETDMDASLAVLQALGNGQLSPAASTQREAVHKAAAVM